MDGPWRARTTRRCARRGRKPGRPARRTDRGTDGWTIASPGGAPMARSIRFAVAAALVATLVLGTGAVSAANHGRHKILDVPLVGLPAPRVIVAGVTGAGHAWAIEHGNAKLFSDGRLLIDVEGLVLTPEGTNPVGTGKGVVSCNGGATPEDIVSSQTVPLSIPDGDAHINEWLTLPSPCLDPVIFFT